MPINAGYEYFEAEKKYLQVKKVEDKIVFLEEMIRKAPKHKGSENLLAELRVRLKKLREKADKGRKSGSGKKGIRKEGFQVVIVGKTSTGKSFLLSRLTNAEPEISDAPFTTRIPAIGTMDYRGIKAQVVDLPPIGSNDFDFSIVDSADCLLIVVEDLEGIKDVERFLSKSKGERIVAINKIDRFDEVEKRKLSERCRSKRLKNYVLVSAKTGEGFGELKDRIVEKMGVIRVFTKEHGKREGEDRPFVLKKGSSVRDLAEEIYKGFSMKVREVRLTGPSAKFANQKVGLNRELKDSDIVEFKV